jgi:hypothetical protein
MAAQGLRVIAAASFLPAFPLLLAHGIVSSSAVPATGLVPLAFSASASLFILLRQKKSTASEEAPRRQDAEEGDSADGSAHPIIVFAADVVLSAALLIVLVFSWLKSAHFNGQQATLATYATLPLLVNL